MVQWDVVREIAAQNKISVERSDQIIVLSHELGGEISAGLRIYRADGALSHNPNIQNLLFGVTDSRRIAWVSAKFYPETRGPESWADWCALTNVHWWTTNKRFYTEDAVYTTAGGKQYHYNPVCFFHGEDRQQLVALFDEPETYCLTIGDEQVVVPRWEWQAK